MNNLNQRRHGPVIALAALSMLVVATGSGYAVASSSSKTITVCVSHKSGDLYKAKKCAKHDKKLSFDTKGPKGAPGAPGAPGSPGLPGANGAVAGYSASQGSNVDLTNASNLTGVLTKSLPAGSYLVSASVQLGAGSDKSGEAANDECQLADGTTNTAQWTGPLVPLLGGLLDGANGTVTMQIAVKATATSAVSVKCESLSESQSDFGTTATGARIEAVQTSSNS